MGRRRSKERAEGYRERRSVRMKERQMRGPRDEAGDLWEGDVQTGAGRVLGGTGRSLRGDAVSIGTDAVRNREKTPRLPRILTTRWTEGEIGLDSEEERD